MQIKPTPTRVVFLIASLACAGALPAQDAPSAPTDGEAGPVAVRPAESDGPALRLISNYLAASGGRAAHVRLDAVTARGTIKEGKEIRKFEITETRDGKRFLKTTWRLLGREYEFHQVTDGVDAWSRQVLPKAERPGKIEGRDGERFINHRWFFHPFTGPLFDEHVFEFRGDSRVGGRPAYLVVGYGRGDVRTWFYFDKETFLVNRYGGIGRIAGAEEYFDLVALEFAPQGGVLLPKRLEFIVEHAAYGEAVFDEILVNPAVDPALFEKPEAIEVWLRQRPREP